MATISSLSQFPRQALQKSSHSSKSIASSSPISSIKFSGKNPVRRSKQNFTVTAGLPGPWGTEKEPESSDVSVLVEPPPPEEPTEIEKLKKQLVESFYGTNRGLCASSETRAEIVELITQLEAKNPTPAPTEALTLLNGKWILAYTSFVALFHVVSSDAKLPFVTLEEISETIESENFMVESSFLFVGPLATTSVTTNAKFEVRSPKRVQIKFEEGIIGTPQLTDSLVFPESVEFLGKTIDLSPIKSLLTSVEDTASSVAKSISSHPPLKFSLTNTNAESWLLTTYLDDELRISKCDAGSVFVFIKEGSPLLTP